MPSKPTHDGLTLKQRIFAAEYVATKGNGTRAALKAGYSNGNEAAAASRASENVRKRKVARHILRLTRKHEITANRVLTRLDNLSITAEEQGQLGAAIKAEELLGKSLGMWRDVSLTMTMDIGAAHLEALRDLARSRTASAPNNRQPSRITDIMESDDDS